jgi:hypothetical protein
VDRELDISQADFLYIFHLLEKAFRYDVVDILKTNTYLVMTVENLASAIFSAIYSPQL